MTPSESEQPNPQGSLQDVVSCICGGEGQYFCWDTSRESGREGYSVNCEDCARESSIHPTMEEARLEWNAANAANEKLSDCD